jgi:hypothetical protein
LNWNAALMTVVPVLENAPIQFRYVGPRRLRRANQVERSQPASARSALTIPPRTPHRTRVGARELTHPWRTVSALMIHIFSRDPFWRGRFGGRLPCVIPPDDP